MTRLSSDSESTATTENDSLTGGNITDDINTHVLEGLLRDLQRGIALGAIRPDSDQFSSSTGQSELEESDQEEDSIIISQQQIEQGFNENSNGDSCNSSDNDTYDNPARPFEESVYQFALSSARRLSSFGVGHGAEYDLRPKFAILKHKTDSQTGCPTEQQPSRPRAYPKTPDWFFNIPDTRSPFPNFESNLHEE